MNSNIINWPILRNEKQKEINQPKNECSYQDLHIDELVQERCNSSAIAMELHLSCTNRSIWYTNLLWHDEALYLIIPHMIPSCYDTIQYSTLPHTTS